MVFSTRLLIPCLLLLLSKLLFADGKVYVKLEEVPTTIPYQRAAIFFDQGKQTLILQSQYEIPGQPKDASMAWIVPVPSVPEIASADADVIYHETFLPLDLQTKSDVTHFSNILLLAWLGFMLLTPLLFVASLLIKRDSFQRFIQRIEKPLAIIVLGGIVIIFAYGFAGARAWKSGGNLEIIHAEKAGIHNVQVIKTDKASNLIDWLKQNGFRSGPEDEAAIQNYIDGGWCFVASRIDPIKNPKDHSMVSNGLLAPLILTFDAPNPVYPTALTATGGYNTEILIYLATKAPFHTDAPIQLRGHHKEATNIGIIIGDTDKPETLKPITFEGKYLTKYKSTLTPAQMAKDIEFLPCPEMPEYREHIFRW